MPAGSFDVTVSVLQTGSGWLQDDADAMATGGGETATQAEVAAGAVNGGRLVQASAGFATSLRDRTAEVEQVARDAATTLTGNADTYVGDDDAAASSLGAAFGGGLRCDAGGPW